MQVVFLIGGGLLTTYISLDYYSGGQGGVVGFQMLLENVPEKFDLILDKNNPNYSYLPGVGVIWEPLGKCAVLFRLQSIYYTTSTCCQKSS